MVIVGTLRKFYEPLVVAARSLGCFPRELGLVRGMYVPDTTVLDRLVRGLPPQKRIVVDPPAGQEVMVLWNDPRSAVVVPTDLPGVDQLVDQYKYHDVTEVLSKRTVVNGIVSSRSP